MRDGCSSAASRCSWGHGSSRAAASSEARRGPSTPVGLPAPAPHAALPEHLAEVEPLSVHSGGRVAAPEEPAEPRAGSPASVEPRDRIRVEFRVSGLRAGERATVEVWRENGVPSARHATDETGTLVLSLEPGYVRASAWTEDLCSAVRRELLQSKHASLAFALELEPCGIVEGTVVEALGATPLEGVRVSLSTNKEEPAYTDSTGRYQLRRARDGMSHLIECSAAGYAPDGAVLSLRADGRWSVERAGSTAVEGAGDALVDFALLPVRTLTGRVVGPDGSPLAGAAVSVQGRYRQGKNASVPSGGAMPTGPDGRFEFSGLPPDITHHVRIETADFATALVAVPPSWGPVRDLGTIALENQASLAGRLFDARGEPVAGLEIRLERLAPPADTEGLFYPRDSRLAAEELRREKDVTSANGIFGFTKLASGRYRIVVWSDQRSIHEVDLELASAEHRRESLTLAEQYLDIQGVVLGPTGPVRGARVELDLVAMRSTLSDNDGGFHFRGLGRADAYHVRAEWDDELGQLWTSRVVDARPGGSPIRLELAHP